MWALSVDTPHTTETLMDMPGLYLFIYTNFCLVYFACLSSRVLQILQAMVLVLIISFFHGYLFSFITLLLFPYSFLFRWSYYGFILYPNECIFHFLLLNDCYGCQNGSAAANDCFPQGRYEIMRNYMPKVGSMGLDMMFRTCTVQVGFFLTKHLIVLWFSYCKATLQLCITIILLLHC